MAPERLVQARAATEREGGSEHGRNCKRSAGSVSDRVLSGVGRLAPMKKRQRLPTVGPMAVTTMEQEQSPALPWK